MTQPDYVLGHDAAELARLDMQSAQLGPETRTILTLGGIAPGMRVLDIGTGTGEVALLAADLVGPTGEVLAVDRSHAALAYAAKKVADRGVHNIRFAEADIVGAPVEGTFDAIVGRLVLAYLPDPTATVRSLLERLHPGGVFVAMEYDTSAMRAHPRTPLVESAMRLVSAAFEASGTSQTLGPHLGPVLADAGLRDPAVLGLQTYLAPDDPRGPALLRAVLSSLLPAIERHGLAAATEIDVATMEERIAAELAAFDAVLLPPTLVGAWGRTRALPAS